MGEGKRVSEMTSEEVKDEVRRKYARVAQPAAACSCGTCCSSGPDLLASDLGYSLDGGLADVAGSFAGCGNPVALAGLHKEEVVLDLGSGAGLDAFVAAGKVGDEGRVIGVDMTPEMVQRANENAARLGLKNVEFRLGDIEDLPVEDSSIDVIISNCVINLAPDKSKVFREAFRVLRPGGRVMISDVVLDGPLPQEVRDDVITYTGCLGGAIPEGEYLQRMHDAGFERVEIIRKTPYDLGSSAEISAYKPAN